MTSTAALTTLEAVKRDLDIEGNEEDAALSAMIGQASASLVSCIGRPLVRETVRQTFRLQRPVKALCLDRFPVAAGTVPTVTEKAAPLAPSAFECDSKAGLLYRLSTDDRYRDWPAEVVVVEYSAGYVLPGAEGRDLPEDIEAAVVALVRRAYHQLGRDPLLRTLDLQSVKLDWFVPTSGDGMPPEVAAVIDRYRQPIIG